MCSSTIPWLTLSFNYHPNNLQQPPLSRLSPGPVGLFKAPVTDGPQSAAVYLSITHAEAKRWRSLSQTHSNSRVFPYISIILCFNNTRFCIFHMERSLILLQLYFTEPLMDMMENNTRSYISMILHLQKVLCSSRETLCSLPQHLHYIAKLLHSPEM